MSVTSGFFNSTNFDRTYDATQVSQIFDGVIEDGIYMSIGNRFHVRASGNGMGIIVGSGRGWFNHTWILNDADFLMTIGESEAVMDRIDAVVIKVDHSQAVRNDIIEIVPGIPATTPSKPILTNTSTVFYHPIAYVTITADATVIEDADIENVVGTSETPFVLAPIQNMDIDELIVQWRSQYQRAMQLDQRDFDQMMKDDTIEWSSWFNGLRDIFLDGDVAERMAIRIVDLNAKWEEFSRTGAFFDNLEDEDGNEIRDEYNNNIIGASVYVKYAQYEGLRVRVNALDHKG